MVIKLSKKQINLLKTDVYLYEISSWDVSIVTTLNNTKWLETYF